MCLSQSLLFSRPRPTSTYDIDELGERALRETKEERDLYQRLHDIEHELNHISDRYQPQVGAAHATAHPRSVTVGNIVALEKHCVFCVCKFTYAIYYIAVYSSFIFWIKLRVSSKAH